MGVKERLESRGIYRTAEGRWLGGGNFGHAGRPGKRGGSAPGHNNAADAHTSAASAHERAIRAHTTGGSSDAVKSAVDEAVKASQRADKATGAVMIRPHPNSGRHGRQDFSSQALSHARQAPEFGVEYHKAAVAAHKDAALYHRKYGSK